MSLDQDFHQEFNIVQEIIIEAGKLAISSQTPTLKSFIKEDNTIATDGDKLVEDFIRSKLTEKFPHYGFIGEETEENKQDISWVVDPIDGTVAYARGINEYSNVIAFNVADEVVFSLIYRPYADELYTAYSGEGAFRNGVRIHISNNLTLQDSLFSLDSGNLFKGHYHDSIMSVINKYRVRIGHSAAIESAYVASGKVDILSKFNQPIWDIAAGYLLMKEAGAHIYDENGNELKLQFSKSARHNYIATTSSIKKDELNSLFIEN